MLARALIAQNDLARAESEIDRLLAVYPRAPAVQSLRGTLYLLKGNASGARAAFQLAFDAEPGSIAALDRPDDAGRAGEDALPRRARGSSSG